MLDRTEIEKIIRFCKTHTDFWSRPNLEEDFTRTVVEAHPKGTKDELTPGGLEYQEETIKFWVDWYIEHEKSS